jgi:hypothetical protein
VGQDGAGWGKGIPVRALLSGPERFAEFVLFELLEDLAIKLLERTLDFAHVEHLAARVDQRRQKVVGDAHRNLCERFRTRRG